MRTLLVSTVVALTFVCVGWAQQSPPADGVGIGNSHLSPNSIDSNVPSMSANQNTIITDSGGSSSGAKGIPAFGGSSEEATATTVNNIGLSAARPGLNATFWRREAYEKQGVAKRTQPFLTGFGPPPIGSDNQASAQSMQQKNEPAEAAAKAKPRPGSRKR